MPVRSKLPPLYEEYFGCTDAGLPHMLMRVYDFLLGNGIYSADIIGQSLTGLAERVQEDNRSEYNNRPQAIVGLTPIGPIFGVDGTFGGDEIELIHDKPTKTYICRIFPSRARSKQSRSYYVETAADVITSIAPFLKDRWDSRAWTKALTKDVEEMISELTLDENEGYCYCFSNSRFGKYKSQPPNNTITHRIKAVLHDSVFVEWDDARAKFYISEFWLK